MFYVEHTWRIENASSTLGRLLASPLFLSIRLLGHFESIVDFDTQISYSAL